MSPRMRMATMSAVAMAATVGAMVVGMSPASAASQKIETRGGGLIGCLTASTTTVTSANCSNKSTNLVRSSHGTYNGHPVLQVKFSNHGLCIDSGAKKSGDVKVHACNTGNYQYLEVFNGTTKGTKVLKSIGAWEHQRVHICLDNNGDAGVPLFWKTCSVSDSQQQFTYK
jgi:hypothetical protein